MKNLILSITALALSSSALAQKSGNIEIGGHIGLPTTHSQYYSAAIGLDVAYTHSISEQFNLGIAIGISHFYTAGNTSGDGINFFPIAARGKYTLSSIPLTFNVDLGAALYESSTFGFYAFPKVGYKLKNHEIYLGYQHLSTKFSLGYYDTNSNTYNVTANNINFGSINIGYNYVIKFK